MEHKEGVLSSAAFAFHKHPLEQVGIALGVEHDAGFATANVLGDQQFSQTGLADTGGAEHQGVADPFAQGQADFHFMGFDTVQTGQTADGR